MKCNAVTSLERVCDPADALKPDASESLALGIFANDLEPSRPSASTCFRSSADGRYDRDGPGGIRQIANTKRIGSIQVSARIVLDEIEDIDDPDAFERVGASWANTL